MEIYQEFVRVVLPWLTPFLCFLLSFVDRESRQRPLQSMAIGVIDCFAAVFVAQWLPEQMHIVLLIGVLYWYWHTWSSIRAKTTKS